MLNVSRVMPVSFKTVPMNKRPLTNHGAIKLIGKELEGSMSKDRIKLYLKFVKQMCKKLNIQPKNLPINSEYKGNLSAEESFSVYEAVFNSALLNEVV